MASLSAAAVAALSAEPLDWRFKSLPASWWGLTPARIVADRRDLFDDGAVGPVCVLREDALRHNLDTMAQWCVSAGVELAPHGKTHMSPQLLARQFDAGACAVTAATVSQVRVFRAFGVSEVVLANELVDAAGLRWLAAELDADPQFRVVCWVDSVAGVQQMTAVLAEVGSVRQLDVCVEVGMAGGRTGCRGPRAADEVAAAVTQSPQLRLVGVAGYEAAFGYDTTPEMLARVESHLVQLRAAVARWAGLFEGDDVVVSAGGSAYFDTVADLLTGDWPTGRKVRTILRSGCYLTHDDGVYGRVSPLRRQLRPALSVWAQVMSRPEPDLALLTMGRRDVSFDSDLPVPTACRAAGSSHSTTSTPTCRWPATTGRPWGSGSSSASHTRARCSTSGR